MRVSERVSHWLLVPGPYQTSPDSSQIFLRMEKGASFPNNWGVLLAGYDSNVLVNVRCLQLHHLLQQNLENKLVPNQLLSYFSWGPFMLFSLIRSYLCSLVISTASNANDD